MSQNKTKQTLPYIWLIKLLSSRKFLLTFVFRNNLISCQKQLFNIDSLIFIVFIK